MIEIKSGERGLCLQENGCSIPVPQNQTPFPTCNHRKSQETPLPTWLASPSAQHETLVAKLLPRAMKG
jgi:hypothetical protein